MENIFLETKLKKNLNWKYFTLINFFNGKQIWEILKNNFQVTNKTYISSKIVVNQLFYL